MQNAECNRSTGSWAELQITDTSCKIYLQLLVQHYEQRLPHICV